MNENKFWHKCSNKKCCANFSGVCRQPFMRCERNIDIAFEVLKKQYYADFYIGQKFYEIYADYHSKTGYFIRTLILKEKKKYNDYVIFVCKDSKKNNRCFTSDNFNKTIFIDKNEAKEYLSNKNLYCSN